ncbi:MAG: DUF559 domain-containing protein [Dactylosporangium sp.]|nr:DUF559 domain-containing protein [Dactylosporangium sp.]
MRYPSVLSRGPFRGSQAVAAGLISHDRLAGPGWRRLLPDIHLRADVLVDHYTWCEAGLLLAPKGTVLGFRSALGLYCPNLAPDASAPVDLIVPRSASLRRHDHLWVHRMRLGDGDILRRAGFPVTTPARTGFDLARAEGLVEAVIAIDALLNRRVTTVGEIASRRFRPLPGSVRAARALALSSPGAESPMETRTRLVLVLAGLPMPETQYEVRDRGVFVARLDLAYPHCRLGIEYDGDQHRELAAFRRDAVRANRLQLCGWTVLRFTADDVLRAPDRVVGQVTAWLAEAGR